VSSPSPTPPETDGGFPDRSVEEIAWKTRLTLLGHGQRSFLQVHHCRSNFYAEWRLRSGVLPALHEEVDRPPERLLQAIWHHQRVRREALRTTDGRPVQVLHPGFWNREAGPDFRGAVLRLGDDSPRSGDVEVDLTASGWRAHRHDRNPSFKNVLLHVVWEGDGAPALPTLALRPFLDAPLADLILWLSGDPAHAFPEALVGECAGVLGKMPRAQITELLQQAALVRLRSKAAQFQARARQEGWTQALWEGMFRALGYKHNVWPMHRLGELCGRLRPPGTKPSALALQARLLGVAGLLPEELPRAPGAHDWARRLWDGWWREREAFSDCALPRSLWRLGGLRPANHPERRLALAAHWLRAGDLPARVEQWGRKTPAVPSLASGLLDRLQVETDEFWSWHWTLRSKRMERPQPLLGATRVTDLAVNVVLPWLWIRAVEGRNAALQQDLEQRYLGWPPGEDNSVLRLARQRLFGSSSGRRPGSAAEQQGLLQVVRDFCEHSDARCADCRFPELAREWLTAASS
jgi:hypothetical protein